MRIPIALLAAVILLPQVAAAEMPKRDAATPKLFTKFDSNGDGKITKNEIETFRQARRKAADKDGDGEITRAEFMAAAEANRKKRIEARLARMKQRMEERATHMAEVAFNRRDTNGDGKLSAAELEQSKNMARFNCYDLNRDGIVTALEARTAKCSFRRHKRSRG